MARPLRPQWKNRTSVRRRHRTWMTAMILAAAGWGVWWAALLLHKFLPAFEPGLTVATIIACGCASYGLFLAVFTIRARLVWVLLASVPIFANASLLLFPLLLGDELAEVFGENRDTESEE